MLPASIEISSLGHINHTEHLHARYNSSYSPLFYGASFDGVTDDTTAFQAAIDACPSGGTVDLSGNGTAYLPTALSITKSINLFMRGGTLKTNVSSDLFVITGDDDTIMVVIDGLQTSGNNTAHRNLVSLATGNKIGSLRISNCKSTHHNISVHGEVTHFLEISGNNLGSDSKSCVIGVAPQTTPEIIKRAVITNNYVRGVSGEGSGGGLINVSGVSDTLILANNHINTYGGAGFDLDNGANRATIIGNVAENIENIAFNVKLGTGRWDSETSRDLTVIGNVAIECGLGLYANSPGSYIGNVVVNEVLAVVRGFYIGADDVTFIGNYAKILDGNGLEVVGGNHSLIQNNFIHCYDGIPISISSGANWTKVKYNRFVSELVDSPVVSANTSVHDGQIIGNTIEGGSYAVLIGSGATLFQVAENEGIDNAVGLLSIVESNGAYQDLIRAFADTDTTPSVFGGMYGNIFTCDNTTSTTITNFDDGLNGQTITVYFSTANTTLTDGVNILLSGSSNYNPPVGALMTFVRIAGKWYEASRINT